MTARSTLHIDERHGEEVARYTERGMLCDVILCFLGLFVSTACQWCG